MVLLTRCPLYVSPQTTFNMNVQIAPRVRSLSQGIVHLYRTMRLLNTWRRLFICLCRPQGCLVIFLSCFLALLVRMDVAGDTCLSALGAMLVALNVVLVLMVVFASRSTVRCPV